MKIEGEAAMNAQPRLSALERRQINLEIRVEEIAQDLEAKHKHLYNDMSASFGQITEYFMQIESRLNIIEPALVTIESTMATKDDLKGMATKEDLTTVEHRLDTIESTMATKEDLTIVEHRLDTIESTMATKEDIKGMATKEDITTIESTMATKADIKGMATKEELNNMETRILDAFNQLVSIIRPQNSSSQ